MKHCPKILFAATLTLVPLLATAHGGNGAHAGFSEGLAHPFTGLDHLAAMLAVGIWSALVMRRVWAAPLAFVALLAAGAGAGFSGVALAGVEPMIAASLLILGLLIATRRGLPTLAAAAMAGGFAFFHGVAHGTELSQGAQLQVLAGMLLGTAMLHLAGIAIGRAVIARSRWLAIASGGAVATLGLGLLTGLA